MSRHSLTFRGEDHAIPAGHGVCTECGACLEIEAWLEGDCPDRSPQPKEEETHEARGNS